MTEYYQFDNSGVVDTTSGFPSNEYEHRWARHHKNFVFSFFLSSLFVLAATIVMMTMQAVGNTAHVLYPVTSDLSYESVSLNLTSGGLVIQYDRELDYRIVGYVDITVMLCISVALDIVYYMQVMYVSNFSIQRLPTISTVSIWKWINYGLSGGVVLIICALVAGVSNLSTLGCLLLIHVIISISFYFMERRNADASRRRARKREIKWNYIAFPAILLSTEFLIITVYFSYLLVKSNGFGHIWFNIALFFISQILFVSLAIMTIQTYYRVSVSERFSFSMMIPRSIARMFTTMIAKLAMFICIVCVSATDLPLVPSPET
jgi:hypothetical protein